MLPSPWRGNGRRLLALLAVGSSVVVALLIGGPNGTADSSSAPRFDGVSISVS